MAETTDSATATQPDANAAARAAALQQTKGDPALADAQEAIEALQRQVKDLPVVQGIVGPHALPGESLPDTVRRIVASWASSQANIGQSNAAARAAGDGGTVAANTAGGASEATATGSSPANNAGDGDQTGTGGRASSASTGGGTSVGSGATPGPNAAGTRSGGAGGSGASGTGAGSTGAGSGSA